MAKTLEERFEDVHHYGVKRHAEVWFDANAAAVNALRDHGFDAADSRMKLLASTIVLRVLDAAKG